MSTTDRLDTALPTAIPADATASTTRLEDLPPLHVTTEGIPAQEHLAPRAHERERRRSTWLSWLIVGLVMVAYACLVVALAPPTDTGTPTTPSGWSQYRADERAGPPTATTLPAPTPLYRVPALAPPTP